MTDGLGPLVYNEMLIGTRIYKGIYRTINEEGTINQFIRLVLFSVMNWSYLQHNYLVISPKLLLRSGME